jgi:conjugal transfer mating pair stabilization protein TraG
VIATLSGRERLDGMWKWLFFLAIFQALLLVPKVTVTIVDRTGNEPPRAVANVPIGLGAFAHAMSKVGDWLTGAFETVFSLPDDVRFRKNGTLFGHRVLAERLAVKSGNPDTDQQPAGVLPRVCGPGCGDRLYPHEGRHHRGQ